MLPWSGGWAKRYDPFTDGRGRSVTGEAGTSTTSAGARSARAGTRNSGSRRAALGSGPASASTTSRPPSASNTSFCRGSRVRRLFHRHFYNQEAQEESAADGRRLDLVPAGEPDGQRQADHPVQPEPGQARPVCQPVGRRELRYQSNPSTTGSNSASRAAPQRAVVFGS